MIRVKLFREEKIEKLEASINSFIEECSRVGEFQLVDIKYSIAHEAVAVDKETGVYPYINYTALMVYKRGPGF